jgi:hypothetical protein
VYSDAVRTISDTGRKLFDGGRSKFEQAGVVDVDDLPCEEG